MCVIRCRETHKSLGAGLISPHLGLGPPRDLACGLKGRYTSHGQMPFGAVPGCRWLSDSSRVSNRQHGGAGPNMLCIPALLFWSIERGEKAAIGISFRPASPIIPNYGVCAERDWPNFYPSILSLGSAPEIGHRDTGSASARRGEPSRRDGAAHQWRETKRFHRSGFDGPRSVGDGGDAHVKTQKHYAAIGLRSMHVSSPVQCSSVACLGQS